MAAISGVVMAACVIKGYALLGGQFSKRGAASEENANPEAGRIPARVPEKITEYEMSKAWFRLDGDFKQSKRAFLDSDTGTLYRTYIQYGVDESGAWDTLSQYISKYRTPPR